MKRLLPVLLLAGCTDYQIEGEWKHHEATAAIEFYERHRTDIQKLGLEQEALGWVIKCEDRFYSTNMVVGTLSNPVRPREVDVPSHCEIRAHLHTHPKTLNGSSVAFFSKSDLRLMDRHSVYLMAQDDCIVRRAYNQTDVNGDVIARLKCNWRY